MPARGERLLGQTEVREGAPLTRAACQPGAQVGWQSMLLSVELILGVRCWAKRLQRPSPCALKMAPREPHNPPSGGTGFAPAGTSEHELTPSPAILSSSAGQEWGLAGLRSRPRQGWLLLTALLFPGRPSQLPGAPASLAQRPPPPSRQGQQAETSSTFGSGSPFSAPLPALRNSVTTLGPDNHCISSQAG